MDATRYGFGELWWVWLAWVSLLGASAGSYLQLVVDRSGRPQPAARSRCPRCTTPLRAVDNVPVLSFVFLSGRCRTCRTRIPRRHLVGELAGAGGWTAAAALLGPSWWLPVLLTALGGGVLMTAPQVRQTGPARVVVGLLPVAGVALLVLGLAGALTGRWVLYAAGGASGAVALIVAALLTRPTSQSTADTDVTAAGAGALSADQVSSTLNAGGPCTVCANAQSRRREPEVTHPAHLGEQ